MKKVIRLSVLSLLAYGMVGNSLGRAAEEYPNIEPSYEMYGGYSLLNTSDDPNSSFGGDSLAAATNRLRSGTKKAIEFEPDENSFLLGGKIESFPLPQRLYLNAEINGTSDWFGELRHAYKDLWQVRMLSRRFVHNLDNIALFDLDIDPTLNQVSRLDLDKEYGFTIDIDQLKMRLKTPNFPMHFYAEGEFVRRNGNKQQLFRGFSDSGLSTARVSKEMDVNQDTKELTVGANSHLGWFEADLSHSWQNFDSGIEDFYHYQAADTRAEGDYVHNTLPELQATKNTLKVHTTQTGQVFASATLMETDRKNVTSDQYEVEAERRLAHADLMWTPRANLTIGTKFRHRENSNSGPGSIDSPYDGTPIEIANGVGSDTNKYLAFVRYSPITKLSLKGQYSIERMERSQQSAIEYSQAEEKDTDTLELGAAWRPRHDLKLNAKYIYKDVDVDRGAVDFIFNNDPQKSHQLTADATYTPNVKTSFLVSALLKKDTADNLEMLDDSFSPWIGTVGNKAKDYDALWQRYLASATHVCSERFSMTATYVYSIVDTDRDLAIGSDIIDRGYNNQQAYHTFSLSNSFQATEKLNLEAMVDYTIATGDYSLSAPDLVDPLIGPGSTLSIADISMTDSKELGLRLDGEYKLQQGWKAGVVLRYVNVIDKSFDNPSDGDMYGALLKVTKVFQ